MIGTTTKNGKGGSITVGLDADRMVYTALCATAKKVTRVEDTDLSILRKQADDAMPGYDRLVNNAFRGMCTAVRNWASGLRLTTRLYMKAHKTVRTGAAKKGAKVGTKVAGKKIVGKKTKRAAE